MAYEKDRSYEKDATSASSVEAMNKCDDLYDGEGDDLLYGTLSYDDHARATFETESRRDKAQTMTFSGALWRLGAFSVFLSVVIELGAVWFRRARSGRFQFFSDDDDAER